VMKSPKIFLVSLINYKEKKLITQKKIGQMTRQNYYNGQ